ncbi:MAG: amino acid permease, partial [Candidatus Bathyarchaeia archaeon]
VAGVIAALSSVNTSIMAYSRVAYALARDGYFPKCLFTLHKRFSTPSLAILFGSVFTVAFAATGIVNFVTYATDFGFIIGFIFVNLSLIKLRKDKPHLSRPFKVPFYPLTPVLGIITSLFLLFFLELGTILIGIALFIFGLIAYYIRMVGYYKICLAMGGMNLSVSVFFLLLIYLYVTNALPITLSPDMAQQLLCVAAFVSIIYLAAGLLNITKKEEK